MFLCCRPMLNWLFRVKIFINKIIIGNHSPLRRHVRCFGTYGVHTFQPHGFPKTHKTSFSSTDAINLLIKTRQNPMGSTYMLQFYEFISLTNCFFNEVFKNYFSVESQGMLTSLVSCAAISLSNACFMLNSLFLVDISPILWFWQKKEDIANFSKLFDWCLAHSSWKRIVKTSETLARGGIGHGGNFKQA